MGFKLITAPTIEPLTVSEAKEHLRLDGSDDDLYVSGLIAAARQYVETATGRSLLPATYEVQEERFCGSRIKLPMAAPLISITSVKYLDESGVDTTLATTVYDTDTSDEPARLNLKWNQFWPAARVYPASVRIRYQAGYATPATIPEALKHAVRFVISHLFENREAIAFGGNPVQIPATLDALIAMYRVEFIV